jgi:SSS family solute:Na+ symporter
MWDLAGVALFAAALAALGLSAKLRDSSVLQYLAAGRSLSMPAFVATLVSTWYGGILGVGESVSYFGLGTWVLVGVPYYVFGVIYAVWLAPRVRAGDQISIPERFEARFGKATALLGAILLFLLAVPAAHVLMLGVLVTSVTPLDIVPAVVLAVLVGTAFLWRGGLLADVRVAVLAFLMMYVGFFAMDLWCLTTKPPAEAFAELKGTPLWTWDGGQGPLMVLSFFILGAWTLVDPGFHQRVASAASPEVGRRGVLASVGFWLLFDLLTITAGLYAVVTIPEILSSPDSLERLAAFPRLGQEVLPPGLRALFFCGMLGTIVSALVGYGLISGATLGREIVARARDGMPDDRVKLWTKVGIAVSFALAVLVGLSLKSVVNLWYSWAGAVVGALLLPLLYSYRRTTASGPAGPAVFWATLLGAVAGFGAMAYGLATENPFLEIALGEWKFSLGTLAPGLAVSAAVLAGAKILAIIRRKP